MAAVAPPSNHDRDYDLYSGTSMSAPHVAGLAALIQGVHPRWTPMQIKSTMMTTATDLKNADGSRSKDLFAQGAGHVNPKAFLDPGLFVLSDWEQWYGYITGLGLEGYFAAVIVEIERRGHHCAFTVCIEEVARKGILRHHAPHQGHRGLLPGQPHRQGGARQAEGGAPEARRPREDAARAHRSSTMAKPIPPCAHTESRPSPEFPSLSARETEEAWAHVYACHACRDLVEDPGFPTVQAWKEKGGKVLAGFAGSVADALTLYEKFDSEGRTAEARATVDRMKAIDPAVEPRRTGPHDWQRPELRCRTMPRHSACGQRAIEPGCRQPQCHPVLVEAPHDMR